MAMVIDITLRMNGAGPATREVDNVTTRVRRMGSEVERSSTHMGGMNEQMRKMAKWAVGFFAFDKLTEYAGKAIGLADAWTVLTGKMELATGSSEGATTATNNLYNMAQRLRVPLAETGTLFGRLVPALKEYGGGTAEATSMTEALSLSLKISGATQAESASSMLQFSQAMAGGALRGEEFNAMADSSPRLLQALADGLGVSRGELKKLAEQGKLTTDVVYAAVSKQLPLLKEEFGKIPLTVGDAWTLLGNAAMKGVGELDGAFKKLDSDYKISETIAHAIKSVADNLPLYASGFMVVAEAVAAYYLVMRGGPAIIGAVTTAKNLLTAAMVRWQASAVTGTSVWSRLNTIFTSSPGIIARCSTAVGALTVAGSAMAALFIGWEIGTWLADNFAWARNAGIFFVSGLLKGFENLKFGALGMWEVIKYGFGAVSDFIKKAMAGTIDFIATMAEKVGATSLASKLRGWASGFQESGGSAQALRESLVSLSAARDKELAFIDQNINEMLDESDARGKVTTATTKQEKAASTLKGTTKLSAEDTKKLKTEYTKLTESLAAQTASLTLTKNGQAQLTATQKLTAEATEFLTKVGAQLTEGERKKLQAFTANLPVLEQQAIAAEKLTKAQEEYSKKLTDGLESLQSRIEKADEDRANMGKTESQIAALGVARDRETLSILLNREQVEGHSAALTKDIYTVQERIKAGEVLTQKLKDNEGFKAQEEQLAANKAKWDAWADDIGKGFTAGFERMLESGKGFWEAFTDSLKNTFKKGLVDWLYTTFAKPFLLQIALAGSGSLSAGGAAASTAGGGGGLSSTAALIGIVKGGFGAMAAKLGGSIASFGNIVGSTALQEFGGGMSVGYGNGSVASGLGAKAGAALPWVAGVGAGIIAGRAISGQYSVGETFGGNKNTAVVIGTTIGAVVGGPLGAAIGGALGGLTNRAFGMGEKKSTQMGIDGNFTPFGFSGQNYTMWEQDGGWFRSDKSGTNYAPVSDEMTAAFNTSFTAMKDGLAGYAKTLGLNLGDFVNPWITGYKKQFSLELGSDEAANTQKITDLFTGMADEITERVLPNWRAWTKTGETASVTFQRLAGVFEVTNAAASLLGANLETAFSGIGLGSANARVALIDFSGGLEAFSQKVGFYYDNFYSDTEKTQRAFAELDAKFDLLGISVGLTKADFRTELEKVNLNDNPERYAALLDLAPLFSQVVTAMGDSAIDQKIGLGITAQGLSDKQLADINQSAATWFGTYQESVAEQLKSEQVDAMDAVRKEITVSNSLLGSVVSAVTQAVTATLATVKSNDVQNDILWRWETQGMPLPRPE